MQVQEEMPEIWKENKQEIIMEGVKTGKEGEECRKRWRRQKRERSRRRRRKAGKEGKEAGNYKGSRKRKRRSRRRRRSRTIIRTRKKRNWVVRVSTDLPVGCGLAHGRTKVHHRH